MSSFPTTSGLSAMQVTSNTGSFRSSFHRSLWLNPAVQYLRRCLVLFISLCAVRSLNPPLTFGSLGFVGVPFPPFRDTLFGKMVWRRLLLLLLFLLAFSTFERVYSWEHPPLRAVTGSGTW